MVTTRRQSKDLEPVEIPRLTRQKRKRCKDATPATSTAQPPKQPSSKRRKKIKSTAKVNTSSLDAGSKIAAPTKATSSRQAKRPRSVKARLDKTHEQGPQRADTAHLETNFVGLDRMQEHAETKVIEDSDSSEDELAHRSKPQLSRDDDDDDADSRYTLGSKQKDKARRPVASPARRTAELNFEEDGLEEVDKAKAAVVVASNRAPKQNKILAHLPSIPVTNSILNRIGPGVNMRDNAAPVQRKDMPAPGVPSRIIMFTITEAIATLALYKDGTMSMAPEVDPQTRQPYEPIQTGDYLSYPVKGNYHLGALGRYGLNTTHSLPFSLTVSLSEYSAIPNACDTATAEPSRQGLGFTSALTSTSQAPLVRRPNNYCFTFGKYRGRRMDTVPIIYLRSILGSKEYHTDPKLRQAFIDLYPKGLYESESESFTFEKGGFKGKRFDEVPKAYIWGLVRKMNEGEVVGGKKGRGRLERALEVWEKRQLDLTLD